MAFIWKGPRAAGSEDVTPSSFSAKLPYDACAPVGARRLVKELLSRQHAPDDLMGDAALVVHELVVNGLAHGAPDEQGRIEVSGAVEDAELVISVRDSGNRGTVAAQPFTADRPGGRGLSMVAALSDSWSVDRTSGTCVSARLHI